MLTPAFTKADRDALLARHARSLARYRSALIAKDQPAARAAKADADAAQAEYYERLPVLTMSTCPFTGQALLRSFDPFGFDGPWWLSGAPRPDPPAPYTFCVLRGAVHLQGKKAVGGKLEAAIGPEVPYVIPRLMELPGMTAVIGELAMTPGHKVYTIAYFADPRPHPKHLTADWPDTSYTWRTLFGETDTVIPVDEWDFDLKPWLSKGRVRWCIPGSGNEKLAPPVRSITGAADCPYLGLKGRREYLSVRGDMVWDRGLPNGEPITPRDLLD
jgi:hypothetical protein